MRAGRLTTLTLESSRASGGVPRTYEGSKCNYIMSFLNFFIKKHISLEFKSYIVLRHWSSSPVVVENQNTTFRWIIKNHYNYKFLLFKAYGPRSWIYKQSRVYHAQKLTHVEVTIQFVMGMIQYIHSNHLMTLN